MRTRTVWIVHLISLANIVLGMMFDLRFESLVGSGWSALLSPLDSVDRVVGLNGFARLFALSAAVLVAAASFVWLFFHAFGTVRRTRLRSIASMLAITTVVAIWCSVASNHNSIAWQGKRVRLASEVEKLESIAAPLRRDWPERDGELENGSPFMAYPFGKPTTLILLDAPRIASGRLCIRAVELSELGAIKLQLSGPRYDDWAEWHPPGSQPESFVGGLYDRHDIESAASIGQGWFLVRYHSPKQVPSGDLVRIESRGQAGRDFGTT
ncbi:hypothetical protein [Neorhodopirellula lusitana]|uniref:hypothetical protein n=1 Tax=Neorhodopirellula lusitana TaxID=445327 RepID=UPI00384FEE4A